MNLNSKTTGARRGFTLIELLTVISIIAILAALLIPALSSLSKQKYIKTATAELGQIQAAIDSYHAKYGSYPPSSTNGVQVSQLYYELSGTTFKPSGTKGTYTTLDGQVTINSDDVANVFGAGGIVNCSKGGGEDAVPAKNFLLGLKPGQLGIISAGSGTVTLLVTSLRGMDPNYKPLGQLDLIPFCYNSVNPTNNPGAYDLWIDLSLSHKTNRISNWSRQVQTVQ